jgi:hypothetical protein
MREYAFPLLLGAIAGGVTTVLVWQLLSSKLDAQFATAGSSILTEVRPELSREIRQTLDREIPPRVNSAMSSTLREYNITPETGRRINAVLVGAERLRLI